MKKIGITILFLLSCLICFGQQIIPTVTSYDRLNYLGGRQNWDIESDDNGIMYFANNDGLLQNILGTWELYPTLYNDVIISVKIQNDTIWTGGNKEFGYFFKEGNQKLKYQHCGFVNGGQAWEIEFQNNHVYLRTEENIIIYDKQTQKDKRIKVASGFSRLIKWNKNIWALNHLNQFGYIENNQFTIIDSLQTSADVRDLIIHNNELYFIHDNGLVFSFNGGIIQNVLQLPKEVYQEGIFSAKSYNKNEILIGTISSGVYIYSLSKKKIIQHITTTNGLKDDTVLAVYSDNEGDIWCALDYGISYIEQQKDLKTIFNKGATYAIQDADENTVLLATNKGLYFSENNSHFTIIPSSQGQVWMIKKIQGKIYICHDKGLFIYHKKTIIPIYTKTGVMDIATLDDKNRLIISAYTGVFLAEDKFNSLKILEDLQQYSNPKLYHDTTNKCVWSKSKDGDLFQYVISSQNTLSKRSFQNIKKVFPQSDEVLFLRDSSIYEYKEGDFKLLSHAPFGRISGLNITALKIIDNGLTYAYIKDEELHMEINIHNGNFYNYDNLFKSLSHQFLKGFEFIRFKNNELQIATERGVITFDPNSKYRSIELQKPIITKVTTTYADSISEFIFPFNNQPLSLSKEEQNIRFNFSIDKKQKDIVEYRSKLIPLDETWSVWSNSKEREFTSLSGGKYEFIVEARVNQNEPQITKMNFIIQKKWYQTFWIILPILLLICIVILIIRSSWKSVTRKAEIKQEKQNKIELNQKTLEIRNEQLIKYAEEVARKNDFLRQVRDGLTLIKNKQAQGWIKKIESEMDNDKKNFFYHQLFSELHHDFIKLLNEKYPQLTSHDHRLISLIRFNLTNQEIANIMNITNRSVIMHRYRLRKKMELDSEIDLDKFINDLD